MFFLNRQVFLALTVFLSLGFSSARAWIYDPGKPLIYEMRIAFETDKWINMYSTVTVLSKSENSEAFRVVANSTVTPTYQLLVTTQGNVGIGTAEPGYKLDVNGTGNFSGNLTVPTQSQGDNSAKAATTAYVDTGLGTKASVTEGDWTIGLTCGTSGTITLVSTGKTGRYVKIGNMVTVTGYIQVDSVSSPLGELNMTGLPFPSASSDAKFRSAMSIYPAGLASGAATSVTGYLYQGESTVAIRKFANGSITQDLAGYVQTGTSFAISLTYFTE